MRFLVLASVFVLLVGCVAKDGYIPDTPPPAPAISKDVDLTPVTEATLETGRLVRDSNRDVEEVREDVDIVKARITSTESVVNEIYAESQGENKKRAEEALGLLATSQAALELVSAQLAETTKSLAKAQETNEQARKTLDEQEKVISDQESELKNLRTQNSTMREELGKASENVILLQGVQRDLEKVKASRNQYRFIVWGTAILLLILVAGYIALKVYKPF